MEQYYELISVPAIASIVHWTLYAIKCAVNNDKFNRFIPLMSMLMGMVCGVVCFYVIPSIIPARNVWVALVIGAASGLTATGTNQIVKQLSGSSGTKTDKKTAEESQQADVTGTPEQQSPSDGTIASTQDDKTEN